MKQNITLSLDKRLLKRVRAFAAERGLSVSEMLAEELLQIVERSRNSIHYSTWVAKESESGKHCMIVRTFVDSNILIYAHDLDSEMRQPQASERLKICGKIVRVV